jgi:hypothetical protein
MNCPHGLAILEPRKHFPNRQCPYCRVCWIKARQELSLEIPPMTSSNRVTTRDRPLRIARDPSKQSKGGCCEGKK